MHQDTRERKARNSTFQDMYVHVRTIISTERPKEAYSYRLILSLRRPFASGRGHH